MLGAPVKPSSRFAKSLSFFVNFTSSQHTRNYHFFEILHINFWMSLKSKYIFVNWTISCSQVAELAKRGASAGRVSTKSLWDSSSRRESWLSKSSLKALWPWKQKFSLALIFSLCRTNFFEGKEVTFPPIVPRRNLMSKTDANNTRLSRSRILGSCSDKCVQMVYPL